MSYRRVGSSPVSRTIYLLCSHLSCARVVELADSLDSGSSVLYGRAGSSPASRTKKKDRLLPVFLFGSWGCEEPAFLRGPRANPAKRFAWGKESRQSEGAFADRRKRGIHSPRRRSPASRTKNERQAFACLFCVCSSFLRKYGGLPGLTSVRPPAIMKTDNRRRRQLI